MASQYKKLSDSANIYEKKFKDYGGTFIYVVKCNEYYKIGISCTLGWRLNYLQCGNPYPLKLIDAVKLKDAKLVEKIIHEYFKDKRGLGEWFKLNDQELKKLQYLINPKTYENL